MKATLPNLKKLAGGGRTEETAQSGDTQTNDIQQIEGAAEPKPPPPLSLFFMLSHLEDDGPVRLDGVKLAVLEVMGLELDEPKLGAFAGSLNALDFPVQLLVRQHPPVLQNLRNTLAQAQPDDLPQQTRDAADSLGRLLTTLENQGGHPGPALLRRVRTQPRRRAAGPADPGGPGSIPPYRQFPQAAAAGLGPGRLPRRPRRDEEWEVEVNRRDIRIGGHLTRSLHWASGPAPYPPASCRG